MSSSRLFSSLSCGSHACAHEEGKQIPCPYCDVILQTGLILKCVALRGTCIKIGFLFLIVIFGHTSFTRKRFVCLFVLWGEGSEKDGLSWWSTLQMFSETYQQHKVEYPRGLHNLIETKCSKCIYVPLKSSDSFLDAARRFVNKELCFWFPFNCKRITWYTLGVSRLSKS